MDAGTKPRHATTKLTPPSSYSDATATETSRRRGVPGCASKRAELECGQALVAGQDSTTRVVYFYSSSIFLAKVVY